MSSPPMEIYMFEEQLERAVAAMLLANGVNDVSKQRDSHIDLGGKTVTLKTPRVSPKYDCDGLNENQHFYVNAVRPWLDIAAGTLYLKVVTRRHEDEQAHSYLRGFCRYLMQNAGAISGFMKYHIVEKLIEQSCTKNFEIDLQHDISALSFRTWLRIRPEFFPTT